jgi:ribosomal protein S18 acetylase RimI-like enzyme
VDVTPSVRATPTETLTAPLVDAAARALARAFCDNAGFVAGLKIADRARRERRLVPIFRSFASTCARRGDAAIVRDAEGGVAAAALAYPPGAYPLRLAGWLQNGWGVLSAGPGIAIRLARVDAFMRKRHLATPHWYLFVLGVDPSHQGTGLGGALLRRLSRQADATGTDCFLETDMEQNVGLYRHHGYEIVDEGPTPLGFHMWHMHRRANGSSSS